VVDGRFALVDCSVAAAVALCAAFDWPLDPAVRLAGCFAVRLLVVFAILSLSSLVPLKWTSEGCVAAENAFLRKDALARRNFSHRE
jgi:hypothetical protein